MVFEEDDFTQPNDALDKSNDDELLRGADEMEHVGGAVKD